MVHEKSERAGKVENITISNVRAVNVGPVSSSISGYPGNYIKNIKLSNIDIQLSKSGIPFDTAKVVPENSDKYPVSRMFGMNLPAYGFFLRHVKNIQMDNITVNSLESEPRYFLVAEDVEDLTLINLKDNNPLRNAPLIKRKNVKYFKHPF